MNEEKLKDFLEIQIEINTELFVKMDNLFSRMSKMEDRIELYIEDKLQDISGKYEE